MLSQTNQELAVEDVLVGGHLPADARLDEVVLEIDGLADWVALSALHVQEQQNPAGLLATLNITFDPPSDLTVALPDGCQLTIEFQPIREFRRGSISVSEQVVVRIVSTTNAPEDHLDDHLAGVTDLVTFLSGRPSNISRATGLSSGLTYRDYIGHERRVQLDWRRRWGRSPRGMPPPSTGVVLRLGELRHHWPQLIRRWFELRDQIGYSIDLLSALAYAPPYHVDVRLLLAAQASEAYHLRMHPGRTHEPAEDFEKKKARVLAALSDKADREWVAGKINNLPTLADRLSDLKQKTESALSDFHTRYPDWNESVREERNRLSHGSGPSTRSGEELYELTECTLVVLSAALLLDLGLSADECRQVFKNNTRHERLVPRPARP